MTTFPTTLTASAAPLPFAIRVLRALNPVVGFLLRSPLHRLLSRDVLLLRYRGRRSGRAFRTPLSYVEHDGALFCFTRSGASHWWRNLRGGAEIEIRIRGRVCPAVAVVLPSGSDTARVPLRRFLTRNPRTAVQLYGVPVAGDGSVDERAFEHALASAVSVRIDRR